MAPRSKSFAVSFVVNLALIIGNNNSELCVDWFGAKLILVGILDVLKHNTYLNYLDQF